MRTNSLQSTKNSSPILCGLIFSIVVGTIQCSWTPNVETPIHSSEQGSIVLQTSNAFSVAPQHPQFLSEPLVGRMLQGLAQSQESGILQEIFLSSTKQSSVFSQTQIDFLAPLIVEAFMQATPEELITFRVAGNGDGASSLSGTIAIFPPEIFFLTLKHSGNYQRNLSKISDSSRQLLSQTILLYSEEQAVLRPEVAEGFMNMSSKDPWIAINYAALSQSERKITREEKVQPSATTSERQSLNNQRDTNSLQKQVQDLQSTVLEQAEQIQELQNPSN